MTCFNEDVNIVNVHPLSGLSTVVFLNACDIVVDPYFGVVPVTRSKIVTS